MMQRTANLTGEDPNQTKPKQNTSHPPHSEIAGIGLNKHKMNTAGKVIYTNLKRHAKVGKAALDKLQNYVP